MSDLLSWTGLSKLSKSDREHLEKKNHLYCSIADVLASSVVLHLEKSVVIYLCISYLVSEKM